MSSKSTSPTGKQRLLNFLRGLLEDESMSNFIIWTNKDASEFRMIKPHKVAELWGAATGNPGMNYDKMSRGLRYFYTNNTLEKVPGKDARYRFIDSSSVPHFSMKTEIAKLPLFNISNLLPNQGGVKANSSLNTSPTSSTSSKENNSRTSPTSSDGVLNAVALLDPAQMYQLAQNFVQFHTFIAQNPTIQVFPVPFQLQLFFNFKNMFPAVFPVNTLL